MRTPCPCETEGCFLPEPITFYEAAAPAIEAWLAEQGLSIAELKRADRRPHMVEARRKVAGYLREHGWSLQRIGDYLDRNHTTVIYLLKPHGQPWARRVA